MAGELGIDPSPGWLDRIDETLLAIDRDPGAGASDLVGRTRPVLLA